MRNTLPDTSSTIVRPTSRNKGLSDDILYLNHTDSCDFVEREYGFDLAELFQFQTIKNGTHLFQGLSNAISSRLNHNSAEVNEVKPEVKRVIRN